MRIWILLAMVLSFASMAAAIVRALQCRGGEKGVLTVRETVMTPVLGVLAHVLCYFVGAVKLVDSDAAGTDEQSYLFVAALVLICGLMGSYTVLYGCVKRVEVFEDRMESCTPFGKRRTVFWQEIVKVERPLFTRALRLVSGDGYTVTIGGEPKAQEEFSEFARKHAKKATGKELLARTENRLLGNRKL